MIQKEVTIANKDGLLARPAALLVNVAGRYASQLESYAWAMSQITGRSVKAKLVYFLRPGEAVEL